MFPFLSRIRAAEVERPPLRSSKANTGRVPKRVFPPSETRAWAPQASRLISNSPAARPQARPAS